MTVHCFIAISAMPERTRNEEPEMKCSSLQVSFQDTRVTRVDFNLRCLISLCRFKNRFVPEDQNSALNRALPAGSSSGLVPKRCRALNHFLQLDFNLAAVRHSRSDGLVWHGQSIPALGKSADYEIKDSGSSGRHHALLQATSSRVTPFYVHYCQL